MIEFPHIFIYPMGGGGIFIRTCIRDMLGFSNGYTFDKVTNEYFCGGKLNQDLTSRDKNVIFWNNIWWDEYEHSSMSEEVTKLFAKFAPDTSLGNIAMHSAPAIYKSIDYKNNIGLYLSASDKRVQWCADLAIFKRDDTTTENFRYSYLEKRKAMIEKWVAVSNPVVIDFEDFYVKQNIDSLQEYCDRRGWKTFFDKSKLQDKIATYYRINTEKVRYEH